MVVVVVVVSDVSLTSRNVLAALRTVQDVEILRDILEVPTNRMKLRQQSASIEEEREGLANYFLKTCPYASWEWLGGQLLLWEQDAALETVKVHIKPDQGKYVGIF